MNDDNFPYGALPAGLLGVLQTRRGLLDGLQLSGAGSTSKNGDVSSASLGGRIGYEFPLGRDAALALGAMVGGYRYKANTPYGIFKGSDFGLNGVDATYRTGPNQFSAEYGMGPDPRLMLRYMREF